MAIRITDILNTELIAAYMTEAESNKIPYLGEAFFPNKKKMGIDLKWLHSHKGLGVALKPSNFDAIPEIRPRGEAKLTQEQMPLFRESRIVSETNIAELARISEANDRYLQPVVDDIYNDVRDLVEGAEIAAERMRMQLLAPTNGNVEISFGENDHTIGAYDYDSNNIWKGANYLALSGSSTWDNKTTSTPLSDIKTGKKALRKNGVTPVAIISNSNTFDYLTGNEQIKSALVSVTGQAINYIDDETVVDVIRKKEQIDWIIYDKMYKDTDGAEKYFYPDDYVTIVGAGQLGTLWRGSTPEELTTVNKMIDAPNAPVDITVLPSGIAIAVQTEYKPSFTITTTVSQIALPSYEGMDGVFVIKVK